MKRCLALLAFTSLFFYTDKPVQLVLGQKHLQTCAKVVAIH